MLEGLLLIILFIIGALAGLLAAVFFIIALVRRSKTMFWIGLLVCIIPISAYALTYWFYDIHIPSQNKKLEERYSGTYIMTFDSNIDYKKAPARLILNSDGTFQLDTNEFTNFAGVGKWKAGAIDGQFEFKNNNNSIQFWASPYNDTELVINEGHDNKTRITFSKK